jgi:hypothetical protein
LVRKGILVQRSVFAIEAFPSRRNSMPRSFLILVGAFALAASAASASAAPIAPGPGARQTENVVAIAAGCGWGFHPNRRGHCVPNRYGYYGPRPYWPGYYGYGYEPWNRPSPTDHVANQLNRQELMSRY